MPEAYRYAFAITLSLDHSLTQEEQKMFRQTIREQVKNDGFYAVVFEEDCNGRLHGHAGQIFTWGRTCSNVKRGSWWKHSYWGPILAQNKYGICIKEMRSDQWICNYMQKDGHLSERRLPQNFEDVKQYFPDTNTARRSVNPEFERWDRMYITEEWPLPATRESVKLFFEHHFYVANDLRIVTDPRKLAERCTALGSFINKAPLAQVLTEAQVRRQRAALPSTADRLLHDLRGTNPPRRR